MNCSVYLFGNLGNGYTAYLNDYTRSQFETAYNRCRGQVMIAIRRDYDLIYYSYVKPLSGSQYFGISLVFNSAQVKDLSFLKELFDSTLAEIVVRGEILKFDDNGAIIPAVSDINRKKDEVTRTVDRVRLQIASSDSYFQKLPPVSFSASSDEFSSMSMSDSMDDINRAIKKTENVCVFIDQENALLNGYAANIKKLSKKNKELASELDETNTLLRKVKAEKKRTTVVAFLAVVLLVFSCLGIALIKDKQVLNQQLTATQDVLSTTENTLQNTQQDLSQTQSNLSTANSNIKTLNERLERQTSELTECNKRIVDLQRDNKELKNALQTVQKKHNDADRQCQQLNNEITKLKSQLASANNVSPSDLQIKLFNTSHSQWAYDSSSSNWYIQPIDKEKQCSYSISVYYKGTLLSTRYLHVNFKR